jgi:hypothetical protein
MFGIVKCGIVTYGTNTWCPFLKKYDPVSRKYETRPKKWKRANATTYFDFLTSFMSKKLDYTSSLV